jgi:hypothetical protein
MYQSPSTILSEVKSASLAERPRQLHRGGAIGSGGTFSIGEANLALMLHQIKDHPLESSTESTSEERRRHDC